MGTRQLSWVIDFGLDGDVVGAYIRLEKKEFDQTKSKRQRISFFVNHFTFDQWSIITPEKEGKI